jgi:hypothetical protein
MSRLHWILAALAVATWIPAYAWFFHRDLRHWLAKRRERRAREHERLRAETEARARMLDELARKYMPPDDARPSSDTG